MNIDFEKILYTWSEGKTGYVLHRNSVETQIAQFMQLFMDVEFNLSKEQPQLNRKELKDEVEAFVKFRKNIILDHCTIDNPRDKKATANWKRFMEKNFLGAISRYNPLERGQVTEEDLKPKTVELPPIVEPEPELKPEKTSGLDEANFPRLDTSNMPKPTIVYDPEMSELLGFNDE